MNHMRKLLVLILFALAFSPLQKPDQPTADTSDGGSPIGSSFLIDNPPTDVSHPSVAYNSATGEYLVVYQSNSDQAIMSARVSSHGQVLGYEMVSYHASHVLKNPDLAYNLASGKFLVVWEYNYGTYNRIYGRIFQPGGSSGAEFDLGTGAALRNRFGPAVAYASTADKFLVVWESVVWQSGTSDIEAQIVSSSGGMEGNSFLVAQGDWQFAHTEPDLAYNRSRNEYLVAWSQEVKAVAQYDIFARRVTAAGLILDPTAITIGYHTVKETSPAVAAIPILPNFGLYAVAWELHYTSSDHDIYERVVTGLGATNPVVVVTNKAENETHPAIAGNEASNNFLVTWSGAYPVFINIAIRGRPLSLSGGVIGQEGVLGGLFGDYPAVTNGPLGDFLVVYQDPNLLIPVSLDIWGSFWGYRQYMPAIYR